MTICFNKNGQISCEYSDLIEEIKNEKISYECSDLIEEIKIDIEEFGDIEMYAFFEKVKNYSFLTNYDFIEKKPLNLKELKDDTVVKIMKASKILDILKKQNNII